ncbi:TetR/AcrR family transcriptional regulator [Marisediminicola sp. LYQ85]|uniref:TetR/AcrR family transcriptional regulator n=1 Tax=Marisediminicola sp. LYQ85 TaxID=3391062 RepID=UPI00398349AB
METAARKNRGPSAGPDNRRALIVAAREVFSLEGFHAPLSAIARRAGVGQGSLYRHFPDRLTLIAAIFDENIASLEVIVDRESSTLDDYLAEILEQALVSSALIDLMMLERSDGRIQHLRTRITATTERIVARERASGRIRADAATDDVVLAISMFAALIARVPEAERRHTGDRAWSLFHAAFAP